jgi:hypothetical protein
MWDDYKDWEHPPGKKIGIGGAIAIAIFAMALLSFLIWLQP